MYAAFWSLKGAPNGPSDGPSDFQGRGTWTAIVTTRAGVRHITDPRWTTWLVTRLLALALGGLAVALVRGNVFFDTTYYAHWAHGTLTGARVPYRDFAWEYPPGALPAMLLPGLYAPLMHDGRASAYVWLYGVLWVAFMLVVDAAYMRALLRRTGRTMGHPARVVWIWGLPLLGALSWARYDMLPAAAAAAALLAAGVGAAGRAGAWAGLGATLKLWPLLIAPVQRTRQALGRAALQATLAVAATAGLTLVLTGSSGYGQVLSYQARRGLQCESLAALPFLWLRHLHVAGYATPFRFGAHEVTGPHIALVTEIMTAVYALGLAGLGLAHLRLLRRAASARSVALTAMVLLVLTLVFNKVFSPQYLLWLLGILAAACVLDPATWRPYVRWVLLACGLTALAFPWFYSDVLGHGWFGLLALTARDVVLLGLAVAVLRDLIQHLRVPTYSAGGEVPPEAEGMPPYQRGHEVTGVRARGLSVPSA